MNMSMRIRLTSVNICIYSLDIIWFNVKQNHADSAKCEKGQSNRVLTGEWVHFYISTVPPLFSLPVYLVMQTPNAWQNIGQRTSSNSKR